MNNMSDQYAILRHRGIVYLVQKENGEFPVFTYDTENPVRVGTWTKEDGIVFDSDKIIDALKTSTTTTELIEKCKTE